MPVTLGLIGGSGLLKTKLPQLQGLKEELVDTPHGRVFLRTGQLGADKLVFVQRHDAKASRVYTQPADINYPAIALALKAKGCDFVVGICSVGSLHVSIGVGSLLVCDDFYCPSDLRRVYEDARAHLMPAMDDVLRGAVLEIVRGAGYHPLPHGVYVNAAGPRFETKAEIKAMAAVGDIVGMTAAHECVACCEVGVPYAMLCMVDNYANGIGSGQLTVEAFHSAQAANLITVEKCVDALLNQLTHHKELVKAHGGKGGNRRASVTSAHVPAAAPAAAPKPAAASGGAGGAGGAAAATASTLPSPSPTSDSTPSGEPSTPATPPGPIAVDLIVHARYVVPAAPGREQSVLDRHSLVVLEGKIFDILPTAEAAVQYTAMRTVDLSEGHVLMPGLVNCHTHLALNLLRGVADDLPLAEWLSEQIWPTEARLVDPDFVRVGSKAAIAELIRSGVTCINEMYWFPESVAEVVEATGIRGTVAMVVLEFPSRYAANADEYISKGLAIRENWIKAGRTDRVRFGFGPHAPYTVTDASFEKIRDLAASLDVPIHLHLHETAGEVLASQTGGKEGTSKHLSEQLCSPIENLDRMGLLGPRMIAVHMTALTDAEIKRVAETGTSVVHCPHSNLKLASGFCPVAKLLRAGVNVAVGTDSASSNNSLDFFGELKLAAVLAKGVASDATAVPAWQALRMATYNGAKALGLEGSIGSLEVGKQADMIAVDLSGIETQPMFNVLSHLAYATSRHNVTDVWVAGTPLMTARTLLTIDETSLLGELREWSDKVRPGATAAAKKETIPQEHRRKHHHGHHGHHGHHH